MRAERYIYDWGTIGGEWGFSYTCSRESSLLCRDDVSEKRVLRCLMPRGVEESEASRAARLGEYFLAHLAATPAAGDLKCSREGRRDLPAEQAL